MRGWYKFISVILISILSTFSVCSQEVNRKSLFDEGINYFEKNQIDSAIASFNLAIAKTSEDNSKDELIQLYIDIGLFYLEKKAHNQALKMFYVALRLSDKSDINLLSNLHMFLGGVYHEVNDYQKAKLHWEKTLKLSRELKDKGKEAAMLNNLGDLLMFNNKFIDAIELYEQSMRISKALKSDYGFYVANINLGYVYLKLKKLNLSKIYLDKAYLYAKDSDIVDIKAFSLTYYGHYYLKLEDYEMAKKFYYQSLIYAREEGEIKNEIDANYGLFDVYRITENFDSALYYQSNYIELVNNIHEKEKQNSVFYSELNYLIDNKNDEILLLNSTNENNKLKNYILSLLIIGLLIISVIIFTLLYHRNQKLKGLRLIDELNIENIKIAKELEREKLEKEIVLKEEQNKIQKLNLDQKSRELSSATMYLISKNEILEIIRTKVISAGLASTNKAILDDIDGSLNLDDDWNQFKIHFENVHTNFFKTLALKYPNLTAEEVRMCSYLRINLSSKEIAQMLYIQTAAVNKRRNRLRKKLLLTSTDDLNQFMINL